MFFLWYVVCGPAPGFCSYVARAVFSELLTWQPDVIVVNLGFNDATSFNWPLRRAEFVSDYLGLIDAFEAAGHPTKIFVCIPTLPAPGLGEAHASALRFRRERGGLDASIQAVTTLRDVEVIDLEWVLTEETLEVDFAHPGPAGAVRLAEAVHAGISDAVAKLRKA